MKNKVCILSPGFLPVPDVQGGAIERVVTMLVEENEIEKKLDLTILSIPSEKAQIAANAFKESKFLYLPSGLGTKSCNFITKLHSFLFWKLNLDLSFLTRLVSPFNNWLRENGKSFDLIINENGPLFLNYNASQSLGRNKFCYHLHGNTRENRMLSKAFGNIISVSDFINQQYLKSSKLPAYKVRTVFNGIDTSKFEKKLEVTEKTKIRSSLGLKSDDFVIVYCGRIVPQKGVKELIEAILLLNNPKIKLLVIGSSNFGLGDIGEYPEQVKNLVALHPEQIKFTGFIPNPEIYKYHQIADVGVVPSTYTDPCPLALFELITSGLPTITTAAGGMLEIGTEKTTLFVDINNIVAELSDAILNLYNDKNLRESMSQNAIIRREYFTRKRFYNDFCDVVSSLVEKK
ncbi:MAG TPA: glycosyltransferase family 4 protein [Paludibacteraceae bacterium]|nr:glycosyltransferase family 4 protein [Paludibacteraceae bacterium]